MLFLFLTTLPVNVLNDINIQGTEYLQLCSLLINVQRVVLARLQYPRSRNTPSPAMHVTNYTIGDPFTPLPPLPDLLSSLQYTTTSIKNLTYYFDKRQIIEVIYRQRYEEICVSYAVLIRGGIVFVFNGVSTSSK